jgi:hypothetical protein
MEIIVGEDLSISLNAVNLIAPAPTMGLMSNSTPGTHGDCAIAGSPASVIRSL